MSFPHYDLLTVATRQHQDELIKNAADFRLVKRSDHQHRSFWRRHNRSGPPEAA